MSVLFTLGAVGTVAYGMLAQPDLDEGTSASSKQEAA
jgi:hypothetical protein